MEQLEPSYTAGRNIKRYNTILRKTVCEFHQKKHTFTIPPYNSTPNNLPKENMCSHKGIYMNISIIYLLVKLKTNQIPID